MPVLLAALRTLGDAPARSLTALAQRLGVSEADAASLVGSVEEPAPVATPDSPLLPMTGRNGASSAPKTLLNRKQADSQWVGSGRVALRYVSPIPPLEPGMRLLPRTAHEIGTLW